MPSAPDLQETAAAYRAHWLASNGAPQGSGANDNAWAVEEVESLTKTADPFDLLDALAGAGASDEKYLNHLGAVWLERFLVEKYLASIDKRCRSDEQWGQMAQGIWVQQDEWDSYSSLLKKLITDASQGTLKKLPPVEQKRRQRPGTRSAKKVANRRR